MGADPLPWQEGVELLRRWVLSLRGALFEDIGEVGMRLNAVDAAGGEDRVDDGAFFAGIGVTDKGPVALTDFGGPSSKPGSPSAAGGSPSPDQPPSPSGTGIPRTASREAVTWPNGMQ